MIIHKLEQNCLFSLFTLLLMHFEILFGRRTIFPLISVNHMPISSLFVCLQSVVYCHGGRIGFYQGDIRLLPDDMKALRPTIFPVVPRLLNRMYDKVR